MPDTLSEEMFEKWRANPVAFIETHLYDPETRKPFKLLPAEHDFFAYAYMLDADGKLLYAEQVYSAPKKSGKTVLGALHLLTTTLLFGSRHAEAYCVANDLEQATSRVFEACRRIVEASPLLKREAKITADKISFPAIGATITALASNYESAAGGHPTISCFDELWGYTSERSRRLWDEMVPVPTRKISCRLVVTHAGFEGESLLLQDLYQCGLQQQQQGDCLYAGNGLLMLWSHLPLGPWQDEAWLASMRRSLRPLQFARMVENRFVATDSAFIEAAQWDAIVDVNARPVLVEQNLPVWVGLDASTKYDTTALAAVAYDSAAKRLRLINHRIFVPSPGRPIDFELVEQTVLDWSHRYKIKTITYDPFQMAAVAQRLTRARLPMQELPQTSARLTEIGSNLYELIVGRNITVYPAEEIRLAAMRCIASESGRGWKITKEKQIHKIDVIVALAMAAHVCVQATAKKPSRMRMFYASGDGTGPWYEVDVKTGEPIEKDARYPGIALTGTGGRNQCHPGPSNIKFEPPKSNAPDATISRLSPNPHKPWQRH